MFLRLSCLLWLEQAACHLGGCFAACYLVQWFGVVGCDPAAHPLALHTRNAEGLVDEPGAFAFLFCNRLRSLCLRSLLTQMGPDASGIDRGFALKWTTGLSFWDPDFDGGEGDRSA